MATKQYNTVKDYMDDMQGVTTNNSLLRQLQNQSSANTNMASATPTGTTMSTRSVSYSPSSVGYDPNVDYSDLIAQEASKGVNANRDLLAQYEAQRNAKIQGMGLNYQQTNLYNNSGGANTTDVGVGTIVNMGKPESYYTATDQSDLVNQLYDAAIEAQKAALKAEYEKNVAAYDAQKEKLPQIYQSAKNQTATDAAIAQQAMNERFAASGLNTGAQGQAALALNTTLQGNLSALDADRAEKLADIEAQRTQSIVDYQNAIAQAIAQNAFDRAQALYNEAIRVDNSYREQEQIFIQNSTSGSSTSGGSYTPSPSPTPTPTPTPTPDADTATPDTGNNSVLVPGDTSTYSAVANRVAQMASFGRSPLEIAMYLADAVAQGLITQQQMNELNGTSAGTGAGSQSNELDKLGINARSLLMQISNPNANLTEQERVNRINSSLSRGTISQAEASILLDYLGY